MHEHVTLLKVLADPTRLKLLKLIMAAEMCVCELQELLPISQSAVSQHMSRLKAAGLVTERRAGQWTYYRAETRRVLGGLAMVSAFLAADLSTLPELAGERARLETLNRAELCKRPVEAGA